ncbi:MAG: rhomboid family intramembrane serine protease [Bacteroidota bacterium]
MMNITPVVKQLLIINILFFIGSQLVPASYDLFALFYPESDKFKGWQPITHMFMHGGIMHIAFNMFALYSFGSALEHFWGGKKFLFFYISCGLGAALLHTGMNYYTYHLGINHLTDLGLENQIQNFLKTGGMSFSVRPPNLNEELIQNMFLDYNTPVVGASGAIYGLLVAFAFMVPNAELALMFIPVPIKAKYFVPGILAVDLFLGFKGQSIFGAGSTGIAHFAHVGGALTGFLMMWYWKKNQFNKNRWN